MTLTIQDRQSLFDIAVQLFGTALAVFELADANNMSITDWLEAGQELTMPETVNNQSTEIINYYNKHSIIPTTADAPEDIPTEDGIGIGYMQITTTFKVN